MRVRKNNRRKEEEYDSKTIYFRRRLPISTSFSQDLFQGAEKFKENIEIYKEIMKKQFPEYSTELRINYPMIYRIIERVNQRRDYYLYFHSNHIHSMSMSQAKEIALFSYWFIKYKPLSFESSYEEANFFAENGYTINEWYVAFLLMGFIIGLEEEHLKYFNERAISTLTYSLTNREISKEALIMYVESFLTQDMTKEEE